MNPYLYIRNNGLKHAFRILYEYKIDLLIQKIIGIYLRHKPLQDVILIESHDDFDNNGGAFYDYLIKNGYNIKYRIIWLIKHPDLLEAKLPYNVDWVPEFVPSIKKNYYKWISKWIISCQNCHKKLRVDQKSIFLTHGAVGLKDCTGILLLPKSLDYCLTASDWWLPFDARQYSMNVNDTKFRICGYPIHDVFYNEQAGDLEKVAQKIYSKTILWMPTFRKNIGNRNDSSVIQELGIPLIHTLDKYNELNKYLQNFSMLLIIKLHPKQDLSTLKISDMSNIRVLTGETVKLKGIDNYRLMKDVDALISDYSSVAYDFLHLNKPIAYDFSDLENYTRGIVVKDPHEMIAGHEIKEISDLYKFIDDMNLGNDIFYGERKELFDRVFKYHDGKSCERIAKLLNL